MNKTVTINLGGTVFHIDDNAYEVLVKYLNAIKSRFSIEQGRDEIMQDIESRIGEMFQERMKNLRQVITLVDVEEITRAMGRPEEFASSEESARATAEVYGADGEPRTYKRRIFRNPDEKFAGGVASGIAAFFDIDPLWIRLAFIAGLFLGGSTLIIYIILWIIIPEAKTTAEKLMMKGEPVTISNIEKNVREEMDAMKQRIQGGQKPGSILSRFFDGLLQVIKYLFRVIGKIFAVFFLFIGLMVSIALFASLFGLVGAPWVHFPEMVTHIFDSKAELSWIFLGVVLTVGIPFLMLAYAAARSLFNLKKGSKMIGLTALGLWILGLFLLMIHGIHVGNEFSENDSYRKEITLQQPAANSLVIQTTDRQLYDKTYGEGKYSKEDWDLEASDGKLISKDVKLDIVKSPTDSFDIVEIFYAHGSSRKAAIDNASKISYSFTQTDSILQLDRHYTLAPGSRWRSQKVQLLVRVPVGKRIKLDESLRRILYDVSNVQNIYDRDMLGRTWEMTDKGLSCVDCNGTEKVVGDGMQMGGYDEDVHIDEHGVHIHNSVGDKVSIDKKGVYVRHGGRDVIRLDENGMEIHPDSTVKKRHGK